MYLNSLEKRQRINPCFRDAEPHNVAGFRRSAAGGRYKLEGKAHRKGVYKCKDCREQFTVTVGIRAQQRTQWML